MKKALLLLELALLLGLGACASSDLSKQVRSQSQGKNTTEINQAKSWDNPVFGTIIDDGKGHQRLAADLIVQVQNDDSALALASRYGLIPQRNMGKELWKFHRADGKDIAAQKVALDRDPQVQATSWNNYAQASQWAAPTQASLSVNDPDFNKQWYLKAVNMPEAWSYTTGSKNVIVAIVDAGFDMSHPEIQGNVYRNPKELNGIAGKDDDGNGYVDDVAGFDFYETYVWSSTTGAQRPLDIDSSMTLDGDQDAFHGTMSAGIIGALTNNSQGIAGMNWNVSLMNVRVSGQYGTTSELMHDGLVYAARTGAHIINFSMTSTAEDLLMKAALLEVQDSGIFVANSSGNVPEVNNDLDSSTNFPSHWNLPNVAAVTLVDSLGKMHGCWGDSSVQLGAPGWDMYSTSLGNTYKVDSGTSFSSPMVAGAAALLKSMNPKWKYPDLKRILLATVKATPALNGKTSSGGMLDVAAALAQAKSEITALGIHPSFPGRAWIQDQSLHFAEMPPSEWQLFRPDGYLLWKGQIQGQGEIHFDQIGAGLWHLENTQSHQSIPILALE